MKPKSPLPLLTILSLSFPLSTCVSLCGYVSLRACAHFGLGLPETRPPEAPENWCPGAQAQTWILSKPATSARARSRDTLPGTHANLHPRNLAGVWWTCDLELGAVEWSNSGLMPVAMSSLLGNAAPVLVLPWGPLLPLPTRLQEQRGGAHAPLQSCLVLQPRIPKGGGLVLLLPSPANTFSASLYSVSCSKALFLGTSWVCREWSKCSLLSRYVLTTSHWDLASVIKDLQV